MCHCCICSELHLFLVVVFLPPRSCCSSSRQLTNRPPCQVLVRPRFQFSSNKRFNVNYLFIWILKSTKTPTHLPNWDAESSSLLLPLCRHGQAEQQQTQERRTVVNFSKRSHGGQSSSFLIPMDSALLHHKTHYKQPLLSPSFIPHSPSTPSTLAAVVSPEPSSR